MTTAADVIRVAKAQVGTQETRSGGHWVNNSKYNRWYGKIPGYDQGGYGYPWCAVFVAWCADQAGMAALYPKTAGCATAVNWYRGKNRFSEYPAVGAQVFFGSGGGSHTGLVYAYDETYIYTVEGNTNTSGSAEGDGVYLKKRVRRDSYVYGYGYPSFSDGVISADPKWGAKSTGATPPKPSTSAAAAKPPAFPGRGYFKAGADNKYVTQLGKQLVKRGYGNHYSVGPGPKWGEADRKNVADFQRATAALRGDPDGYPGPLTWRLLFS